MWVKVVRFLTGIEAGLDLDGAVGVTGLVIAPDHIHQIVFDGLHLYAA